MKSLTERLGLQKDSRVVILHADDVGLSHSHNLGFFRGIETGSVTCGSVIVPAPWFPEIASYARAHPEVDLGVHLCLNSEFSTYRWGPVCGSASVPSLVDGDGYFWASPSETLDHVDFDEARQELRAQIDRALGSGIDVTHLDAHMGTAMMRGLLGVYMALGREYRLPIFFPRPTQELLREVGRTDMSSAVDQFVKEFDASGMVMVDHCELGSLGVEPETAEEHYAEVFSSLKPGVTHLLIHPAVGDDELQAITPDSWRQREAEARIFGGSGGSRLFEVNGILPLGYRPIRDLIRASI